MRLIGEGAESRIYETNTLGVRLIVKDRIPKQYRITKLDLILRKNRTRKEAKMLYKAKNTGLNVPNIVALSTFSIWMEVLDGTLLKDSKQNATLFIRIGKMLALLHNAGMTHGDFTPANLMIYKGKIYFIDFGLGGMTGSIEEMALDLLLMKRSVNNKMYNAFISGYSKKKNNHSQILHRLKIIEKRGRYQTRTLS